MKEWVFKYQPNKFDNIVLNEDVKKRLQKLFIEKPTFMLVGKPGVGKGTFTNIFLNELGVDYIKLNCSDETSVDVMRTKVKSFATSLGNSDLKYVVLNEADFISLSGQAMLRDLIEQVESITRFIFQCNYIDKIIPELISRCQVIELNNPPAIDIYKHCKYILDNEKVSFEKNSLVKIVKQFYPDIRKTVNTIQLNSIDNVLKSNYVASNDSYEKILISLNKGDIEEIRKELRSSAISYPDLYSFLYENVGKFKSPGDMILLISEYLYRDNFISIKEINFMGMVVSALKGGYL